MKLFVICGHGAGDPGACHNGYEEAERVRVLGKKIKELGGNNVMLGDVNRNYYEDDGIEKLTISKDYQIIELHMDSASASARGAHIIINSGFEPDKYDEALADFLCGLFPGRSKKIAERSDLANPKRAAAMGYGYRLAECGFISNKEDLDLFNNNIEKIAKGILEAFGISTNGASSSNKPSDGKPSSGSNSSGKKTIFQIAKEVINGEWGNGDARKKKLEAAGYDYDAVQKEVNKQLGVSTSTGGGNTPSSKKKTVTLPASASSWRVYPTNKAPVIGNECGYLYPSKFGGLTYDILATPQTDVVTIQTRDYGKVNIYVAKSTGAIIK